jgi:predicted metal-dependent hydrolase
MSSAAPPPLTARLEAGRAAFDRGEFFEAHELWEDVWRELAGEDRRFVQGLIQIAAGRHHLRNGRSRPGTRLLAKGMEKIAGSADPGGRSRPRWVGALLREASRIIQTESGADR